MMFVANKNYRALMIAAALVATATLGSLVVANGSFNGDTIGTHPFTEGDGNGNEYDSRPVFFIEGPSAVLFDGSPPFTHTSGTVGAFEAGPATHVRLEFSADSVVGVDLVALQEQGVSAGFRVAPRGGATKVSWSLGEQRSAPRSVGIGAQVELPVQRLMDTGMLEGSGGFGFTGFHAESGRTHFSILFDPLDNARLMVRPSN